MQRIPVFQHGAVVAYALVDDADAALTLSHRWRLHPYGYAQAGSGKSVFLLHRFLMGLRVGDRREVDHKDRDPLNCQRSNMRLVTRAQNMQNLGSYRGSTSRYRGVSWQRQHGKWRAQAKLGGVGVHLGYFVDEEEAAAVAAAYRETHMTHATG